jgi:hypothetical protein
LHVRILLNWYITERYQTTCWQCTSLIFDIPHVHLVVTFYVDPLKHVECDEAFSVLITDHLPFLWMQELLLLVLPLLNMMSIRKVLMFPFSTQAPASSLPEDACPICEACPIITPYMALPCCHVYCYYCLRTRSLSDRNFKCSRCSISVVALKRYQVEVGVGES